MRLGGRRETFCSALSYMKLTKEEEKLAVPNTPRAHPAAVDQPSGSVPGDDDQLQPSAGRRTEPSDRGDRARP